MSKPFDYYAGYPGQQKTPKWIGVVLGSLFGGMAIIAVAIAVRLVVPAHVAEAAMIKPTAPVVAPALLAPVAPAVAANSYSPTSVDEANAVGTTAGADHARRRHGKGKHNKVARGAGTKVAKAPKLKETKQYKHAQVYAKSISNASHRDKRARADLDKMLGL